MNSSELVLNWGIISTGLISQDFCTALISLQSPYHVIRAVAARKLEDAKKFAEKFSIEMFFESYDKLFDINNGVNIVYIGTINYMHKELCLKAIAAGKHVLCEKPMTLNSKEQEEVLEAAKEKGVFFMEGLWTRFFPVLHKLKHEIDHKAIGEMKFFSGNFMTPIKEIERIRSKELGGGAILDIGIYPIQLACFLFNHEMPLKITATGHLMSSGVDECCTIVLLYSNQRIAQINLSTSCVLFSPSFIIGDKGVIQIPENSWCPTELILANGERFKQSLPDSEKTNFNNSVGLRFEAEEVRLAIANGQLEHAYMTHDHSRLIMHIMDEARKQLGYF